MENTNGFYYKGIWFTAYEAGLWLVDHSGFVPQTFFCTEKNGFSMLKKLIFFQ